MLLTLPALPAPRPLRAALLGAIGRAERLRWLSHADERAVAVAEGAAGAAAGPAEGGAWAEAAHEAAYSVHVGSGVAAEQVLPIAGSLHAQALARLQGRGVPGREREGVAEARELLSQALLIRDRVGGVADEAERLAHLEVVSDLGVALAHAESFEEARAMQERALRMVQGSEAAYRGFVSQVHARLAALQRRQERFEQQRQRAAWLMESFGLGSGH